MLNDALVKWECWNLFGIISINGCIYTNSYGFGFLNGLTYEFILVRIPQWPYLLIYLGSDSLMADL